MVVAIPFVVLRHKALIPCRIECGLRVAYSTKRLRTVGNLRRVGERLTKIANFCTREKATGEEWLSPPLVCWTVAARRVQL
jgi:hypothetical protein